MENIELFEEYIAGSLSPEDKASFKKKLSEDKDFAEDFKIFLFTVDGVIKEEKQDNADFENAMKHISRDQLLDIIGRRRVPKIFRFGYLRERALWISGVAALFIILFVSVFFTYDMGNRNIDNLVADYYYIPASKGPEDFVDIQRMSPSEVREYIPILISEYEECSPEDIQACQETGLRIAIAYIKIHNRKEARMWLEKLINRFWDDRAFVEQCQTILDEID